MHLLHRIKMAFIYILGGLFAFILLYIFFTYLLFYLPVNKNAGIKGEKEISIYVMTNGVHTDIVVPVRNEIMDWSRMTKFEHTASKDTTFNYAAFGWGDKGFYLQTPEWSDLKFSVAFSAMFHLGSTAMHVDFIHAMHENKNCREIRISKVEYEKLVNYIKESFEYNKDGEIIQIPGIHAGYGPDDAFYEAKGAYDVFHTCNTWANSALKSCNQKACWWTPMDRGIFHQYPDKETKK